MTRAALLLVDLQEDFLEREGLVPARESLVERVQCLLAGCRSLDVPVAHVRTRVRADLSDAMPHWRRDGLRACLEGTPGAAPPPELAETGGEPVFAKRFYGAFGAPGLGEWLAAHRVRRLVLAGVYLHACVRQTALEAYEHGLEIWIADDAVGSTDPVHAELTRHYLAERVADFAEVEDLLHRLGAKRESSCGAERPAHPAACVGGRWLEARQRPTRLLRSPADRSRLLGEVALAGREQVSAAAQSARDARAAWSARPARERADVLARLAAALRGAASPLEDLVVREVGKPRVEARGELERAVAHAEVAARVVAQDAPRLARARVCARPLGTVALITPWNNPVAIPIGKLAPALGFGNTVVWKPALEAPETARRVHELLVEAGVPAEVAAVVFGAAETARWLIRDPAVDAVSITGSDAAGRSAAAACAQLGRPLQAELGGNNAAVVLADFDPEEAAAGVAAAAFGFAGQRCTATRRILVERGALEPFTRALVRAAESLPVGDPADPATRVGPLISERSCRRLTALLARAGADGGRILCGGGPPSGLSRGCYFSPTLVSGLAPGARLVREESFGPLAVILPADDFEDALRLANAVPQGLVASVFTRDAQRRERFAAAVEAGIVQLAGGALAVDAEAPFGGWKASAIGPPEHGIWDREFYSRPQALYGSEPA